MVKELKAIYENGVLRPLEPLELDEHQHVVIMVSDSNEDWLDNEYMQSCASEIDDSISLEDVRKALSKISAPLTNDFIQERDEL